YTIKGAQKLLKGQSKGAIAAAHAATEAAEKARHTAQNAAPVTAAAKPVEQKQPAADLPPAVVELLQGMLSDLKDLRAMVVNQDAA
ncbi:MAG: MerR family transcriptional regulator, partial [Alphaproteobacteria bacterium]|nr:MerR family transcriptional regulator [Alphaproteobacteria bacterium]